LDPFEVLMFPLERAEALLNEHQLRTVVQVRRTTVYSTSRLSRLIHCSLLGKKLSCIRVLVCKFLATVFSRYISRCTLTLTARYPVFWSDPPGIPSPTTQENSASADRRFDSCFRTSRYPRPLSQLYVDTIKRVGLDFATCPVPPHPVHRGITGVSYLSECRCLVATMHRYIRKVLLEQSDGSVPLYPPF
jgi:hypothetical protein